MADELVKKSRELFEVAKALIPGGVQKARHPKNFTDQYPIFMERGEGSHVWDVDGNEYIDWLLSYGPLVLGHGNKKREGLVIQEKKILEEKIVVLQNGTGNGEKHEEPVEEADLSSRLRKVLEERE